jgi:hypothetical protein
MCLFIINSPSINSLGFFTFQKRLQSLFSNVHVSHKKVFKERQKRRKIKYKKHNGGRNEEGVCTVGTEDDKKDKNSTLKA